MDPLLGSLDVCYKMTEIYVSSQRGDHIKKLHYLAAKHMYGNLATQTYKSAFVTLFSTSNMCF